MPDNADPKRPTILQQVAANQERGGEHIRTLVRIAELHDRRLTHLEGEQQ